MRSASAAEAAPSKLDPSVHICRGRRFRRRTWNRSRARRRPTRCCRRWINSTPCGARGIFQTFLKYETDQFDRMVDNTLTLRARHAGRRLRWQWHSGARPFRAACCRATPTACGAPTPSLGCIANMTITGPRWLFTGTAPMQWRPDACRHRRRLAQDARLSGAVSGVADRPGRLLAAHAGPRRGLDRAASRHWNWPASSAPR